MGKNINLKDKIIKKTSVDENKNNIGSKTINKNKESITNKTYKKNNDTEGTVKMTFYIKENLYSELRNFAYWDRYSITEAFNIIVADGLKGKEVKKISG